MDRKVALNRVMVSHLSDVVGLSMRNLTSRMGMPNNTLIHWTDRGTIRVRDLVKLCNVFFIPFRCFLTFGEEKDMLRKASTISLTKSTFRKVKFHYERIHTCGNSCNPPLSITSIINTMGVCYNKYRKFCTEEDANNFTVDDFLRLCEVTGLPMDYFLEDPSYKDEESNQAKGAKIKIKSRKSVRNQESPKKSLPNQENHCPNQESPEKSEKIQESPGKSDHIEQLIEENRKLREQVERLLGRMEELENRLNNVATKQDITRSVHRYGGTASDLMQTGENNSRD